MQHFKVLNVFYKFTNFNNDFYTQSTLYYINIQKYEQFFKPGYFLFLSLSSYFIFQKVVKFIQNSSLYYGFYSLLITKNMNW